MSDDPTDVLSTPISAHRLSRSLTKSALKPGGKEPGNIGREKAVDFTDHFATANTAGHLPPAEGNLPLWSGKSDSDLKQNVDFQGQKESKETSSCRQDGVHASNSSGALSGGPLADRSYLTGLQHKSYSEGGLTAHCHGESQTSRFPQIRTRAEILSKLNGGPGYPCRDSTASFTKKHQNDHSTKHGRMFPPAFQPARRMSPDEGGSPGSLLHHQPPARTSRRSLDSVIFGHTSSSASGRARRARHSMDTLRETPQPAGVLGGPGTLLHPRHVRESRQSQDSGGAPTASPSVRQGRQAVDSEPSALPWQASRTSRRSMDAMGSGESIPTTRGDPIASQKAMKGRRSLDNSPGTLLHPHPPRNSRRSMDAMLSEAPSSVAATGPTGSKGRRSLAVDPQKTAMGGTSSSDSGGNISREGSPPDDPLAVGAIEQAISDMHTAQRRKAKPKNHMYLKKATKPKMIRSQSMKNYMSAFKGMSIGLDGTVKLEDFMRHVKENAPALADQAMAMFDTVARKSKATGDGIKFGDLLRSLYPGVTNNDVEKMISMVSKKEATLLPQGVMLSLLDEAKEVFAAVNKSGSGFLSRSEAVKAVSEPQFDTPYELTEDDVLDLFGQTGTSTQRDHIPFASFFQWYSGIDNLKEYSNLPSLSV